MWLGWLHRLKQAYGILPNHPYVNGALYVDANLTQGIDLWRARFGNAWVITKDLDPYWVELAEHLRKRGVLQYHYLADRQAEVFKLEKKYE